MRSLDALQAYKRSVTHRNPREQEADVFRQVNRQLRVGQQAGSQAQARALAENERLWITVIDVMRDPENALPAPLRASILSVAHAVRREAAQSEPDIAFITGINENIASGLAGL